jgi:hypothetical protein
MRKLTRSLAVAATAVALAVGGAQAPASANTDLPNFRFGIQMIDNGHEVGDMEFTPFLSFGGGCSPWANDTNTFDPDGARINLDPAPRGVLGSRDFRIGIQATDRNGSETGPLRWSPWTSEGGGVSPFAFDANAFDPDQVRVCLEARPLPAGIFISDFRFSIKVVDLGGADQGGFRQFTPWAFDRGGVSPWAFDSNAFDPDGFAVGIEVF